MKNERKDAPKKSVRNRRDPSGLAPFTVRLSRGTWNCRDVQSFYYYSVGKSVSNEPSKEVMSIQGLCNSDDVALTPGWRGMVVWGNASSSFPSSHAAQQSYMASNEKSIALGELFKKVGVDDFRSR